MISHNPISLGPAPGITGQPVLPARGRFALYTLHAVDALLNLHAVHAVKARYALAARGKITSVGRPDERPGERVENDLRRRIADGEWQRGQQLPAVAALAEHYGVAGGTVARVLRRLAADGLVKLIPGWGTFRT
jgi:Bacterial regulatory proteins, gntR family